VILNSDTPTYNLRAVVQETGLKADTLRAWERRYGLPVPKRSEGGHRLYSRRDIETLKWLVARVAEGLSISRAVELWRTLEETGEDPIADLLSSSLGQVQPIVDSGSSMDEIREAWIKASLNFDEQTADSVIAQAFAIYPIETVTNQILLRAMSEIGEKWFTGEVSVQQEHFISQLTLKRLGALLVAVPPPTRAEKIIVTCPPGEEHTIPMVLLTLGLRRKGFQVYYFGADTPVNQLDEAISSIEPNLIISSAQQLATSASLLSMALALYEQEIPFAYGGRIFNLIPELQNTIPGHYLGETLDGAFEQIEHIAAVSLKPEFQMSTSNSYDEVIALLQDHQSEIAAKVLLKLAADATPEEFSKSILDHLNSSIISTLRFGDPKYVTYDLEWLKGLQDNRLDTSYPVESILQEYVSVAEEILDSRGKVILDWIQDHLAKSSQRSNS
jgi:DNA-binding transcriptional MerR regulator